MLNMFDANNFQFPYVLHSLNVFYCSSLCLIYYNIISTYCVLIFFSQIIEKKKKHKKLKIDNTDESKGIHLFNGSPKLLNSPLDEPTTKIKRKRHLKNTSDEIILQRASETAVSSEWILNRDAVQGWEKVTKGKIMKVKSNREGTFDIINDEV